MQQGCTESLDMLGLRGNEIAHKLARSGSVLKFAGNDPGLTVSREDIRRRIRR